MCRKAGEVVDLALHVGVPKRGVAFAATPEGVTFATEAMRDIHRLLHLRGGVSENVGVRAGGSALAVTRMGEEAGGAPEELLAGLLLRFFGEELVGDGVEAQLVAFGEIVSTREPHRGHGSSSNPRRACP
jgi:hypothetical protein